MCGPAGKIKKAFQRYEGFIIDIEGVLIKGDAVIPQARETIDTLGRLKKKLVFLSNISDKTREEVAAQLRRHGFPIASDGVITSAYAAALFLREKEPAVKNVFLIGTDSFKHELNDHGFSVTDDHDRAEAVVVGLDNHLDYDKICGAAKAVKKGCLFVASNLAKIKLTADGYVTGPGFTVKGLEYVTGKEALLAGKPGPFMFGLALKKLNLRPPCILTIGDKLEQDIYGGHRAGTDTCLVLSGAAGRDDPLIKDKDYRPTVVVEKISEILETHS